MLPAGQIASFTLSLLASLARMLCMRGGTMIPAIGIYEARNKLSELLDRVETGETIAITRHGEQVAPADAGAFPTTHRPTGDRAAADAAARIEARRAEGSRSA